MLLFLASSQPIYWWCPFPEVAVNKLLEHSLSGKSPFIPFLSLYSSRCAVRAPAFQAAVAALQDRSNCT